MSERASKQANGLLTEYPCSGSSTVTTVAKKTEYLHFKKYKIKE